VTLDDLDSPAWVGRRQQHFSCHFSVGIDFEPTALNEEAGITVFMNNRHHYDLGIRAADKGRRVFVRQRIGPLQAVVAEEAIPAGPCELAIRAAGDEYTFFCNGKKLPAVGEARYLSTEVAKGFTGVYLAMYATGGGHYSAAPADFDWCKYLPDQH
jgi:alpha-N-arabinofuranosidase